MGMTDPIADMLTRIRNGSRVHFKSVEVLNSRINLNMAKVLKKSGYISGFEALYEVFGCKATRDYRYSASEQTGKKGVCEK
jgi:small subunit ribosomal protein S8